VADISKLHLGTKQPFLPIKSTMVKGHSIYYPSSTAQCVI